MINLIVPIVEDVEKFETFIRENNSNDMKIFVGIKESLAKYFSLKAKNVEIHIFENKSNREEIINALHSCKMEKGKLMIVRRPLANQEFFSLVSSTKDIVTLKSKHNKFVSAIKKFMGAVVKRFFAFNFFEDISAICYGESMFELLSVCTNLSMASRINKYVGIEIEEIETNEKQVKKDYSRSKAVFKFLLGTLFFLGSLAGGILVCLFTPLKALIVILVIFWVFFALVIWLISIVNYTRTLAVGDIRYGKAEEKV